MNCRPAVRGLLACGLCLFAVALAGCGADLQTTSQQRAEQRLSPGMQAKIKQNKMAQDSPILVRLFKEESELEVWKQNAQGRYALLKTYPICRWSGELGPKIKEGDRQAPEGFYSVTPAQMNPNSSYYLSFNLGYPNAFDRAHGRTGTHLMVHGDCSSRGCYAMTDEQIGEIFALAREAFAGGQRAIQVQAYPFRMTPENLARHRANPNMPFWRMLKEGHDHFEVTLAEPKVDVCERRYVFNAQASGGEALAFNATGRCPSFEVPAEIRVAVAEKRRREEMRIAELSRTIQPAPVRMGTDGGMHRVFLAALKGPQYNAFGSDTVQAIDPPKVATPGTIPSTAKPPGPPQPVFAAEASSAQAVRVALADTAGTSAPTPPLAPRISRQHSASPGATRAPSAPRPAQQAASGSAASTNAPVPAALAPRAASPANTARAPAATSVVAGMSSIASPGKTVNGSHPTLPAGSFIDRWSALLR